MTAEILQQLGIRSLPVSSSRGSGETCASRIIWILIARANVELLKLRAETPSNLKWGRELYRRGIDHAHAAECVRVARVYGDAEDIITRSSWAALVAHASPFRVDRCTPHSGSAHTRWRAHRCSGGAARLAVRRGTLDRGDSWPPPQRGRHSFKDDLAPLEPPRPSGAFLFAPCCRERPGIAGLHHR